MIALLPNDFDEFIAKDTNRMEFLKAWFTKRNIFFKIFNIDESSHFFVKLDDKCYDPNYKIKTFVAHYDRAENSPGANDNSAAVFQLLNLIEKLSKKSDVHNCRFLFTDSEENRHLKEQGTYRIAKNEFSRPEKVFRSHTIGLM